MAVRWAASQRQSIPVSHDVDDLHARPGPQLSHSGPAGEHLDFSAAGKHFSESTRNVTRIQSRINRKDSSSSSFLDDGLKSQKDDGKSRGGQDRAVSIDDNAAHLTPTYVRCGRTGRRLFHVDFDVDSTFTGADFTARVTGDGLLAVQAERREEGPGRGRVSAETFCRRIKLPHSVDCSELSCWFVDGRIEIEAPVMETEADKSLIRCAADIDLVGNTAVDQKTQGERRSSPKQRRPLNEVLIEPEVGESSERRVMSVDVETGSLFSIQDITVRLQRTAAGPQGGSRLVVTGERREETPGSRMAAQLRREFELSMDVDQDTLTAGLTVDGILRITAVERPSN